VARAIEILKTDLIRTMRLLGCDAIRNLDARYVDVPVSWHAASAVRQLSPAMQVPGARGGF